MDITAMFPEAVKGLKNRDRELLALSECVQAAADLLIHNWNSMRHRQGDAMTVALTYTVTLIGKQNKVKTKLAYSERHTDEREVTTADPQQPDLPLDGELRRERTRTTPPVTAQTPVIDVEALPPARAPRALLNAPPTEPTEKPKRKRKKKMD